MSYAIVAHDPEARNDYHSLPMSLRQTSDSAALRSFMRSYPNTLDKKFSGIYPDNTAYRSTRHIGRSRPRRRTHSSSPSYACRLPHSRRRSTQQPLLPVSGALARCRAAPGSPVSPKSPHNGHRSTLSHQPRRGHSQRGGVARRPAVHELDPYDGHLDDVGWGPCLGLAGRDVR